MEKKCNNAELQIKGLTGIGEIFFYQRWSELLNPRTLDEYQYNVLNSYVALTELYEVIINIKSKVYALQNARDCVDETIQIIESDRILLKECPALLNRLKHHLHSVKLKENKENKDECSTEMLRLQYQVSYAINKIKNDYLSWIINSLYDDIISGNFEYIEKHASFLVSQCVDSGWSSRGLYELRTLFHGTRSFLDKWNNFSRILKAPQREYEVFFSFEKIGDEDISQIKGLGLNVLTGKDIIAQNSDVDLLVTYISQNKLYISIGVSSCDAYSSASTGLNMINNKMNIAAFYNILEPWLVNKPSIISLDKERKKAKNIGIHDLFSTYDYVDSSATIFEKTKNIYKKESLVGLQAKLNGVFSYTNLGKISLFQEVKFLNLWVAIESVVRTGQYGTSIIDHLKHILPPVLCTRYIYRIIRNFAEDCKRCEVTLSTASFTIDLNQFTKGKLAEEIIQVFKDNTMYADLLALCSVNTLLKYRCSSIRSILMDNKKIAEVMKAYNRKITWHLQRLYRIRNSITHSAFQTNKSIIKYIEHLYDYLTVLISEIVYYIDDKGALNIEEAFANLVDNYNAFIALMEEGSKLDTEITRTGVINLLL